MSITLPTPPDRINENVNEGRTKVEGRRQSAINYVIGIKNKDNNEMLDVNAVKL